MSPIAPAGRSDLPLLDALDHRILAELQADASLTNVELARRVHASAPTCLRRVHRLIESGVIERQVALVAPAALGASLGVVVEVTLDSQAAEHLDHFQALACAEPSITQCYRVSPGPDFVLSRRYASFFSSCGKIFRAIISRNTIKTTAKLSPAKPPVFPKTSIVAAAIPIAHSIS